MLLNNTPDWSLIVKELDSGDKRNQRKCRGTRDQIPNIHWIIEKAREFQKNTYYCFIDYTKAFDCVDHKKTGKFLKKWEYKTTFASRETCMLIKKQTLGLDME